MAKILSIFRFQNLAFIAFIQWLMNEAIITPILQMYGFETGLNHQMLLILIGATVLIAAGGYVLNDYFDIKIDTINKPDKVVVGKLITRRTAMIIHQIISGIGIVLGLFLSYTAESFSLAFIFLVIPGLLWFYSASYKRLFLVGNLTIAFLASMCIIVVGIAEISFLQKEYGKLIFETSIPTIIYSWLGAFAVFAFLMTWMREIIKDMEDIIGDKELECRTMAVIWGNIKTKKIIYLLIAVIIIGLLIINQQFEPINDTFSTRYILIGIVLPLLFLSYLIYKSNNPNEYQQAALFTKVIMLIGVLYSLYFYYFQAKLYNLSFFNLFKIL